MANAVNNLSLVNQATNPSKSETDRTKLAGDFNQFLTLLTTQLKNQDPTEPLDTNQFTQQLVEFSQVEQSVQSNTYLEKIANSVDGNVSGGANYLGKTVEATGNTGLLSNGQSQFTYDLPEEAADVSVVISDADGNAVFSGTGPGTAGKNIVSWDGTNSFNEKKEPDGTYAINVVAKDAHGDPIEATTYATGVVTAATMVDGALNLLVNNQQIPIANIVSIRQPTQVANN